MDIVFYLIISILVGLAGAVITSFYFVIASLSNKLENYIKNLESITKDLQVNFRELQKEQISILNRLSVIETKLQTLSLDINSLKNNRTVSISRQEIGMMEMELIKNNPQNRPPIPVGEKKK